ncbi:MAG: LAGLIDADG family homing endonuclease, partial [Streptosporangiaceae bacterium]
VYPQIRRRQELDAERARLAAEAAAAAQEQRRWPDLLARIGHQGVRFAGREETLAGYLVHLRLPGSGRVTYSGLVPATEKLEVAARLRHGSLRFERGAQAHEVILHVAERDVLAETVLLPAEPGSLSITRPIPVGMFEDGQVCAVTLREVATLIVGLRGSGKALALDTPVPAPDGWTTMGEIRADDVVYDETGQPCRVTDAWDIRRGRPCYEIEFSDGSTIVADAEHQWLVDTDASRRSARAKANLARRPRKTTGIDWHHDQDCRRKPPEVVTTETMRGSLRVLRRSGSTADGGTSNYSIKVAAPLRAAEAKLAVPPYTLGAWLGDGWSAAGAITTADAEILIEIEAEGETVWIMPSTDREAPSRPRADRVCLLAGTSPCSPTGKVVARGLCAAHWAAERRNGHLELWSLRTRDTVTRARVAGYRIGGLKVRLRQIGVLSNKHVPTAYLRASEAQRRALLAGLLDTDGHCSAQGGIEFYSTSQRLARDVRHLAATLGYKPTLRSRPARLNGQDCGTVWTVAFTTADKVFRLPRKAARQVTRERSAAGHRYVTAIRPVPSVPVRCIAVDSPSHLYLVGESCIPTHNSNLLNVLLAQLARCPDVLIFAIDLKGGRMAAPWIEPWLEGRTPRPVVDWLATDREEAERMLRALERAIQARSRSGSGGEKITPSPEQPAVLLVCDEIAVILGVGTGGPRSSLDGVTNATLARLATQLVMTGRSEAIDLIMATQRGTVTMLGSADLKSQCAVRIGLGVASEGDARLIIPDDTRIATDLARLGHPGTGIVQQGKNGRVLPVKFYRIEHEMISEIAERYGRVRPGPDKVLEEARGEDSRTRWSPGRIERIPGVGSRPLVPALAGGQQR